MDTPKLAGKYSLLRKLAAGGMAEVWLARQEGLSGFEKLVVVKRIHPHLAEDPSFVRMFLDEARASADLRHPNIVTVFEIGEDRGTYFLVMEYLHGADVRQLFRGAIERQTTIPLAHAVQIVIDAAHGLAYAHRKTDLAGRPLGIVHRDVSPSNVVVSLDGATKVIDFGIAKAQSQAQETTAGQLKGKVTYMSPEQVTSGELDHRSDQFSLGIVLYELTTMRRLFALSSEAAVAKAIMAAQIPRPTELAPGYPPALEPIVLRALAREPEDRYPDCDELAADLEQFLAQQSLPHSTARVGKWVREQLAPPPEPQVAPAEPVVPTPAPPRPNTALGIARVAGAEVVTNPGGRRGSLPPQPVDPGDEPTVANRDGTGSGFADYADESGGTSGGPRTNLPADAATFVGRKADLRALERRFSDGARLVTLLGPGGTGKTRLALRFGTLHLEEYARRGAGGVWLADLSGCEGLDDVCSVMAGALGVTLATSGERAVTQLGHALAARGKVLCILDNFEQLTGEAAATVGRWLGLAREARFLVTSRELLRLPSEFAYDLDPLAVPAEGEDAGASEAVQLFVDRARAARPDLELSVSDLDVVGEIVRALDGLPLAIELAAARVRVFSPRQILERLPRRFELLASPRRDGGERQATLRGAIDWSWKLLAAHEQAALAQCSVFRGGFTLEAAEEVLDLSAFPGAPWVPDVLQVLREKSLLRARDGSGPASDLRFGMYESIRAYAKERFAQDRAAPAVISRHAAYYLRRGEEWAAEVAGDRREAALAKLAADLENLGAVHDRATSGTPSASRATVALRAALVLEALLSTRGPYAMLEARLDTALARAGVAGVDGRLRAKTLLARAVVRRHLGRVEEGLSDLAAAAALAAEAGDVLLQGQVRLAEGRLQGALGRLELAEARFAEVMELQRTLGDRKLEGQTLGAVGDLCFYQGRIEEMEAHLTRAVGLLRAAGDAATESSLVGLLGYSQHSQGKLAQARQSYERALALHRRRNERRWEAQDHYYLGQLLHEEGNLEEAQSHFERALRIHRAVGDRKGEGDALYFLGTVHHAQGRPGEALAHYDEALEIAREVGEGVLEGFAQAMIGAAQAGLDRLDEAEEPLAAAEERILGFENPLLDTFVGLCRGHLDLAVARRAEATGDVVGAAVWRDLVARRIEEARARGPSGPAHPAGAPSAAERSDDVRLALRVLEQARVRAGR